VGSFLILAANEVPVWDTEGIKGRERRAAIAIRDNVTPFQKWGTRIFTVPYLRTYYGTFHYFTLSGTEDHEERFRRALAHALAHHDHVDLFLLAHGNKLFRWVEGVDADSRQKLRLVYNTGCSNAEQWQTWLDLGAETYVGHPGKSKSSIFYFYFLRRWASGWSVKAALEESNVRMKRTLWRVRFLLGGESRVQAMWTGSRAMLFGKDDLVIGGE